MEDSICNFASRCLDQPCLFHPNYMLQDMLGRGGFGVVYKCQKKDTKETIAVKIVRGDFDFINELTMLNLFMENNLDRCNIVRFIEMTPLENNMKALAFEMLDVTLKHYILYDSNFTTLDLRNVRSVVQQMATALNALKTYRVIHTDIKLDNIMLVDCTAQPLQLKLIDFGLAFPTCCATQGDEHQTPYFRAPEIFLGLPFSEAIDMWSLGIVMATILLTDNLFPGHSEYDVVRCMVELLGVPPKHLLKAGIYSDKYFVKGRQWRLKTPKEHWGCFTPLGDYRSYDFRNLDDIQTLPLPNLKNVEADEKKECVDLLKAMLQMDANDRITPSQVLAHPFITRGTVSDSDTDSDYETVESSSTSEPRTVHTAEPAAPSTPRQILVRPAQTSRSLSWEEDRRSCLGSTFGSISAAPKIPDIREQDSSSSSRSGFYGSDLVTSHPRMVMVRPAPPERRLSWDEDSEENFSEVNPCLRPYFPKDESTTSDDSEPEEQQQQKKNKKKKKKNCFRRFFRWVGKKLVSCFCAHDDEDR